MRQLSTLPVHLCTHSQALYPKLSAVLCFVCLFFYFFRFFGRKQKQEMREKNSHCEGLCWLWCDFDLILGILGRKGQGLVSGLSGW